MVVETAHPFSKYLRAEMMPHIWCPGCGNGIVLNCLAHALDEIQFDLDKLVTVSGIGCIGRTAGYVNTDSFHTTHGRALAFATGVKLSNPELEVVVVSGDGDLFAIGGNHFIHAARRNIGVKVLCVNNLNYGMTGGQQGPTTPLQSITTTSPYGNVEHPFNLVHLAAASGATYVARWTTLHVRRLTHSLKRMLQKRGFCFVEVLSPCPEIFGRYNKMRSGLEMMAWFRKASVIESFSDPSKAEISSERIPVGEFLDIEKLSYERLVHEKISEINEKAIDKVDKMRVEVRFAGFGGQGIIKSGIILAAAAAIHGGKDAVQTQSYGPESRGGACKSEVVISEDGIDFPKVVEPDVLVLMSQHAYNDFAEDAKAGGIVILDPDMIPREKDLARVKVFRVPATRMAEELGRKIVANIVMLGAFVALTNILDEDAVKENVPKGTEELNLAAFEKGYEFGKTVKT